MTAFRAEPDSAKLNGMEDYVVKNLPSVRLAALTATLQPETIAEHVEPMFVTVAAALPQASGILDTPIATYAETDDGIDVAVGYAVDGPVPDGVQAVELPAQQAACGVHLGPMTGIRAAWQDLHRWVVENGYTFAGPCRELYVRAESADQSDWVTELQQPVA